MLSICIPVFNYDVRNLVNDLHQQALAANIEFEILLVDDHSEEKFKALNRKCSELPFIKITELDKNIGRSAIRNLLAREAQYPWLIFMDCDSQCPDKQYIERYLAHTHEDAVVCGGRSYLPDAPQNDTYLHWLFGTHREVKPAWKRAQKPNHSFMTNNFLISSQILQNIGFNESLLGYGHEDTLFGVELYKKGIRIKHIDNPLIHIGLQNSEEFLNKTCEATRNLLKVYSIAGRDPALPEMVRLLKVWAVVRRFGLCKMVGKLTKKWEHKTLQNLKGENPKLVLLDLFKLGTICRQTIIFNRDHKPKSSSR